MAFSSLKKSAHSKTCKSKLHCRSSFFCLREYQKQKSCLKDCIGKKVGHQLSCIVGGRINGCSYRGGFLAQMSHPITQKPSQREAAFRYSPLGKTVCVPRYSWLCGWSSKGGEAPNLFFGRNESDEFSKAHTMEFCSAAKGNEEARCQ